MASELAGRLVLLVEDEPLVALHVEEYLTGAGARVLLAHALLTARVHALHPELSAAVLDHRGKPALDAIIKAVNLVRAGVVIGTEIDPSLQHAKVGPDVRSAKRQYFAKFHGCCSLSTQVGGLLRRCCAGLLAAFARR